MEKQVASSENENVEEQVEKEQVENVEEQLGEASGESSQNNEKDNLPKNKKVYILGKTFKPETNIITGSPSVLLGNFMKSKNIKFKYYDPFLDKKKPKFESGLYFIGTRHIQFKKYKFPKGSTVIDPFRYIPVAVVSNTGSLLKYIVCPAPALVAMLVFDPAAFCI